MISPEQASIMLALLAEQMDAMSPSSQLPNKKAAGKAPVAASRKKAKPRSKKSGMKQQPHQNSATLKRWLELQQYQNYNYFQQQSGQRLEDQALKMAQMTVPPAGLPLAPTRAASAVEQVPGATWEAAGGMVMTPIATPPPAILCEAMGCQQMMTTAAQVQQPIASSWEDQERQRQLHLLLRHMERSAK
jgi:hypothetical protein